MRSGTSSSGSVGCGAAPASQSPGLGWASRSLSRSWRCMGARSGSKARLDTGRLSTSPCQSLPNPPHRGVRVSDATPAAPVWTVLVADDNEVAQRLCRRVLEKAGYGVLIASDGIQAVDIALHQSPTVILMDVAMPGMDGLEAMSKIKAEKPGMRIVI